MGNILSCLPSERDMLGLTQRPLRLGPPSRLGVLMLISTGGKVQVEHVTDQQLLVCGVGPMSVELFRVSSAANNKMPARSTGRIDKSVGSVDRALKNTKLKARKLEEAKTTCTCGMGCGWLEIQRQWQLPPIGGLSVPWWGTGRASPLWASLTGRGIDPMVNQIA